MFIRFIIIFLIFVSKATAEEISGIPKIIDGDTVHINNYKFRLEGIDAPEMKQQCKKESLKISSTIGFSIYKDYSCGQVSKAKLKSKINGSKIKCIFTSKDRYKRYIATCFKGEINLNQWMVRNGYAIAYRRYSEKYVSDEDFAKEKKLGLWQGKFMNPEKWRKLN
ncbi:thermonuclease family protein [Candidatus Pelagibacter communis]|uniref:thermonuclease family protein n=1 Tax=Pelagibacter ubique TaxID=198252 RepID=UPI00094CC6A6|nr:thermonuclease family protein [Candidatus Pelagibacter ubique]